jgi:hypothetical protein
MMWRRRRDRRARQHARLAGGLLDEALRVFCALQAASYVEDRMLDDDMRERFRVAARDLLDDVACLAPLVVTAPTWPAWPSEPWHDTPGDGDEPPVLRALQALSAYTASLDAVAETLVGRQDDTATVFVELATAADSRIEALGP